MTRGYKWFGFLATTAIVLLLAVNVVREPARQQQAQADYQAAAVDAGMDLYAMNCARCHGAAGEGLGVYRALDQEFIINKDPRELYTVIHFGRYATDMAAFGLDEGGNLTPAQIDRLVVMLQAGSWEAVEARVAALGMLPTEADIAAATRSLEVAALNGNGSDPAVVARGRELFAEHCTECHGEAGEGTADAPQLNNAYVRGMPDSQLYEIVGLGVRNTEMEGFAELLPAEDLAALIALLHVWDDAGASPADSGTVIATAEEIAAVSQTGQEIFEMWCGVCHGVRGEGGAIAPSLNDIPALPADFLVSRVRNGKNAMPPFSENDLPNGQLAVVIEYAQSTIIGSGLPVYSEAELSQGGALYVTHCAECHGAAGEGVTDEGPRINTLPPMRAVEITNFTRVGSTQTPAIPSSEVSDADLRLIVAYIHSLSQQAH